MFCPKVWSRLGGADPAAHCGSPGPTPLVFLELCFDQLILIYLSENYVNRVVKWHISEETRHIERSQLLTYRHFMVLDF